MVRFTFKSFCVNNLEQELGDDYGKFKLRLGVVAALPFLSMMSLLCPLGNFSTD